MCSPDSFCLVCREHRSLQASSLLKPPDFCFHRKKTHFVPSYGRGLVCCLGLMSPWRDCNHLVTVCIMQYTCMYSNVSRAAHWRCFINVLLQRWSNHIQEFLANPHEPFCFREPSIWQGELLVQKQQLCAGATVFYEWGAGGSHQGDLWLHCGGEWQLPELNCGIFPCELNLSFHSLTKCIRLFQASRKAYSKVCRSESLVESSVACAQSICIHLRRSLLFGLADEWFSSVLNISFNLIYSSASSRWHGCVDLTRIEVVCDWSMASQAYPVEQSICKACSSTGLVMQWSSSRCSKLH